MKTDKFYAELLEKIKDRDDIIIEKYRLNYKEGDYDFLKIKSREIKIEDKIILIRAGVHGEEISGPLTFLKDINQIINYAHKRGVKIIIYPLANPLAFDLGLRQAADGLPANDCLRYKLKNGEIVEDLKDKGQDFIEWYWASDKRLNLKLTPEDALMQKLLKEEIFLGQIAAVLDLHQDYLTPKVRAAAYHYAFGNLKIYHDIIKKIKKVVPVLKNFPISAGEPDEMKSDENGFIIRYDGTFIDLFFRLGVRHSVTAETTGKTPLNKAQAVNLIWIFGLVDLVTSKLNLKKPPLAQMAILPKKITPTSRINLIHTSSPVDSSSLKIFNQTLERLKKEFSQVKVFDVKKTELDPRYLAASEKERLQKFRRARKKVDWLAPIYGGTGCGDIIRHLNDEDLAKIRKNRPVINGFSDTTFLINYFYFRLKLLTFHYFNGSGLFLADNHKLFFDILKGTVPAFSFWEKDYEWLSSKPESKIEGAAIGGNLSIFRDLLDLAAIKIRSWKPYILFVEDIALDIEDLHRIIVALDEKGIFKNIRALVIGRLDEKAIARDYKKFNFILGQHPAQESPDKIFNYLLSPIISLRKKQNDPLPILKINNFGHNVRKNTLIIPVGGKTIISPDGRIEFIGPFVK